MDSLKSIRLLAIPVVPMHPDFRGVDVSVIGRVLDERLAKRGGYSQDVRQELVRILTLFSRPEVWSLSATQLDQETGGIDLIDSDGFVVNEELTGKDQLHVPSSILEALAVLVSSEMAWNIPPGTSRTGFVPLSFQSGVRWTVHRPLYGGESFYSVFARKVATQAFLSLEDLVRNGTIQPAGAEIIQEHLSKSPRIFLAVTGAPASGKTTFLNAILRYYYKLRPKFYYALYGDAIDNPLPAHHGFFPPTSFENDVTVLNRCNSFTAIIGEIANEITANVAIRLMSVMANVFTTIHAQRIPYGVGEHVAALAGKLDMAERINENLTMVIHLVGIPHGGRILRRVREIWLREFDDAEMRCVYRLRLRDKREASPDLSGANTAVAPRLT